ncbi:hypothetical protein EYF80_066694 [Liparis tanakae]|uniref:Uncharacterized protein n=1 Tax=Liparis tanakae TaxID=230148 RepID=A0A4Z2E353_9TELE|nr:hypothetical protein EYF80_066694 [Liparis tanakae]
MLGLFSSPVPVVTESGRCSGRGGAACLGRCFAGPGSPAEGSVSRAPSSLPGSVTEAARWDARYIPDSPAALLQSASSCDVALRAPYHSVTYGKSRHVQQVGTAPFPLSPTHGSRYPDVAGLKLKTPVCAPK